MANYNTENNPNKLYTIWLVTEQGDIFIKDPIRPIDTLMVSDLTIAADSIKDLIKEVNEKWGILCTIENIKQVSKYDADPVKGEVYILQLKLNNEFKDTITLRTGGKFIYYQDVDRHISMRMHPANKDYHFLESYIALISYLGKKYEGLV